MIAKCAKFVKFINIAKFCSKCCLQVLARMCSLPTGHKLVADAISMLRLRFGEPVRFKFLIGETSFYRTPTSI